MTQFNFGYNIRATDRSQAAVDGARKRLAQFRKVISAPFKLAFSLPRRGLALARDLRLALGPAFSAIARGFANAFDEGARFEVVQKAFQSQTRTNARDAAQLARFIRDSSNGTLTLVDSMRLANRAMAGGIDVMSQLPIILDFTSKKAIATGKDAGQALDTVITGLARGSTLFLDDFGILTGGVDEVRRNFDRIKGSGAFDQLGPAAQKAETVRQALQQMQAQTQSLGLTGRESVFQFEGLKNTLKDSIGQLFRAVTLSDKVKQSVAGLSKIILGFRDHIMKGGSLSDILFGKAGGQGRGLFGLGLGLMKDMGRALGGGIVDALDSYLNDSPLGRLVNKFAGPAAAGKSNTSQSGSQNAGGKPNANQSGGRGLFSATFDAFNALQNDFFGLGGDGGKAKPPNLFNPNDIKLTERGVRDRQLQLNLIDRELRKRTVFAGRDARRLAAEELRRLRRSGIVGDRDLIEKNIRERLIEDRTRGLRDRRAQIEDELGQNQRRRGFEEREKQQRQIREGIAAVNVMKGHMQVLAEVVPQMAGAAAGIIQTLTGTEQRLVALRGAKQ